jgi:hypothetical protein
VEFDWDIVVTQAAPFGLVVWAARMKIAELVLAYSVRIERRLPACA